MKCGKRMFGWALVVLVAAAGAAAQSNDKVRAAQAPAGTLRLEDLVAAALRANPAIRAAELRVEALEARVPQAKALPDPTVSAGWMGKPAPFVVNSAAGMSYRGLSAMETFPFPGKLKLRGEIADRESRAAWWDYQAARRQVVSQVKAAYYEYAYDAQALVIVENSRVLLEKLTKIAETRYEAGLGLQQDVLKGQVEVSQLLEQIAILEEERQTAAARLNTLLDRDPQTPLPPPPALAQTKLAYTLPELFQLARRSDTGIQQDQRLIERDRDAVALARKSYDPDFSVGYMYRRMPGGPNLYGAQVGINIPIFYKSKQREEVVEASRNLASDTSVQESRETEVNYQVKEQYLAAEEAAKLAALYSQALVPQTSETLASSELAYEAGKVDFLTMLDNFVNLLDDQVHYDRQIADYQIALARLEPLVGVELVK